MNRCTLHTRTHSALVTSTHTYTITLATYPTRACSRLVIGTTYPRAHAAVFSLDPQALQALKIIRGSIRALLAANTKYTDPRPFVTLKRTRRRILVCAEHHPPAVVLRDRVLLPVSADLP